MARRARLRSNSQVYHVMLRGAEKQDIFIDDEDKKKIMQILIDKKQDNAFFVYAYCILNNHIHLVIREGIDDITRILKRAATSYASYFNKKYSRSGHVFQDRFKSETINDEPCLQALIRFIHQNPESAGIAEMDKYPWSSYREFVGQNAGGLTDYSDIPFMVSKSRDSALKEFVKYSRVKGHEEFLDITQEREISPENVNEYIREYLKNSTLAIEDLKRPEGRKVRDSIINYLLNGSNLSRRNIAEILGINRETVRKASLSKGNAENISHSIKAESA